MKKLAIYGAGGHGRVVADAAELQGWSTIYFFDEAWPTRKMNGNWPIAGNLEQLKDALAQFDGVIVAIGNNAQRSKLSDEIFQLGGALTSIIHPAAIVSNYATIGLGTVIFAGVVINHGAEIGVANIINTAATVDHDCQLALGVHVSPGAHLAGSVKVGALSWIGIGASIKQNIKIGDNVTVGAGAAVVKDVTDDLTVIGVPAIKQGL